jgi:hypothetical protein
VRARVDTGCAVLLGAAGFPAARKKPAIARTVVDATQLAASGADSSAHGARSVRKTRKSVRRTKACALNSTTSVIGGTTIASDRRRAAAPSSGSAAVCGGAVHGPASANCAALRMTVLFDPKGASPGAFGVKGMPTPYVIDRSGTIHFTHTGYRSAVRHPRRGATRQRGLERRLRRHRRTAGEALGLPRQDAARARRRGTRRRAAFVLGPKAGLALVDSFPGMAAVIAYRRPDGSVGIAMSATLAASWHPSP